MNAFADVLQMNIKSKGVEPFSISRGLEPSQISTHGILVIWYIYIDTLYILYNIYTLVIYNNLIDI